MKNLKKSSFAKLGRLFSAFGIAVCLAALNSCACGPASDSFGKDHPIPQGMTYEIPLEENAAAPAVDTQTSDSYLQLWNGIQGGVYNYSLYYPELPDGEVYLRCFEATENIELSASRLRGASTVEVKNHTGFGKVADKQQFSIYEGDWDDYYAARIEVWHKNASTNEETKLLEKVYRVEGWMR